MPSTSNRPIALTIAGSDSSGGAGIQADLKTFSALGVYGASVITALTAQNTMGVRAVHVVPVDVVVAQMAAVFDDLAVGAIKTGMLASEAVLSAVTHAREQRPGIPLVVDPVMVATSGDRLLDPAAVATLKSRLAPRATLITPNLPEAAALLGCGQARSVGEMEEQARALLALGSRAVLLKGGHRPDAANDGSATAKSTTDRGRRMAVDVLVSAAGSCDLIEAPWVETVNTHGTGCTLSAAITALLARDAPLDDAVRHAKTYLTQALDHGRDLRVGHGSGPVDHLFAIVAA